MCTYSLEFLCRLNKLMHKNVFDVGLDCSKTPLGCGNLRPNQGRKVKAWVQLLTRPNYLTSECQMASLANIDFWNLLMTGSCFLLFFMRSNLWIFPELWWDMQNIYLELIVGFCPLQPNGLYPKSRSCSLPLLFLVIHRYNIWIGTISRIF